MYLMVYMDTEDWKRPVWDINFALGGGLTAWIPQIIHDCLLHHIIYVFFLKRGKKSSEVKYYYQLQLMMLSF